MLGEHLKHLPTLSKRPLHLLSTPEVATREKTERKPQFGIGYTYINCNVYVVISSSGSADSIQWIYCLSITRNLLLALFLTPIRYLCPSKIGSSRKQFISNISLLCGPVLASYVSDTRHALKTPKISEQKRSDKILYRILFVHQSIRGTEIVHNI